MNKNINRISKIRDSKFYHLYHQYKKYFDRVNIELFDNLKDRKEFNEIYDPYFNCDIKLKKGSKILIVDEEDNEYELEIVFCQHLENFIIAKIIKENEKYKIGQELCFPYKKILMIIEFEKKLNLRGRMYKRPIIKA